jgi:hypothetical protein
MRRRATRAGQAERVDARRSSDDDDADSEDDAADAADDSQDESGENSAEDPDSDTDESSSGDGQADCSASDSGAEDIAEAELPGTSLPTIFRKRCKTMETNLQILLEKFSRKRWKGIERGQAKAKGVEAVKKLHKRQCKRPRVAPEAILMVVSPDGGIRVSATKGISEHKTAAKALENMGAALDLMVREQQLCRRMRRSTEPIRNKRTVSGASRINVFPTTQDAAVAQAQPSARRIPPSRAKQQLARQIFRKYVVQKVMAEDQEQSNWCGGSQWRKCRESNCRCEQKCDALRTALQWPSDLPCVNPNQKTTNVDSAWSEAFLAWAAQKGWHNPIAAKRQQQAQTEPQPQSGQKKAPLNDADQQMGR